MGSRIIRSRVVSSLGSALRSSVKASVDAGCTPSQSRVNALTVAVINGSPCSVPRRARLPYKDFGVTDLTGDGSHLMYDVARQFVRDLGEWLSEDVGWE